VLHALPISFSLTKINNNNNNNNNYYYYYYYFDARKLQCFSFYERKLRKAVIVAVIPLISSIRRAGGVMTMRTVIITMKLFNLMQMPLFQNKAMQYDH
jgi:hypothetical protein